MAILVYKLTNAANGKAYIGITSRSLDMRWLEHCGRARQGVRNSRLAMAMRKYGEQSFTREILTTCETEDEARSLETHFILHFDTYATGYNANEGGHGALHFTAEQRRKIGDAQRGKVNSPEARAKMSAAKKTRPSPHHLGKHLLKGAANPRASIFTVRCPDGSEHEVTGLRAFCRENRLQIYKFTSRPSHKGYALLTRPIAVAAMENQE